MTTPRCQERAHPSTRTLVLTHDRLMDLHRFTHAPGADEFSRLGLKIREQSVEWSFDDDKGRGVTLRLLMGR